MNIKEFFDNYDRTYDIPPVIDKFNALRKWGPILDSLKITDDKLRGFTAEYAEYHQRIEHVQPPVFEEFKPKKKSINMDIDPYGEENWDDDVVGKALDNRFVPEPLLNYLPVSLKVLSKLNILDKNLFLATDKDMPTITLTYRTTREEIFNYRQIGADLVQQVENILINKMIEYINKELETKENLYVHKIVNSIDVDIDANMNPVVTMTGKCRME